MAGPQLTTYFRSFETDVHGQIFMTGPSIAPSTRR